jgi:hypothetical protein
MDSQIWRHLTVERSRGCGTAPRRKSKNGGDARPHPGLLPQEKENRSPAFEMSCGGDSRTVVEQSEDSRRLFPLLGRNDSVEIGERDRPGRSSRRPADWLSAPRNSPNGASSRGSNGLRRDAENNGRDARAPQSNCIVPVGERVRVRASQFSNCIVRVVEGQGEGGRANKSVGIPGARSRNRGPLSTSETEMTRGIQSSPHRDGTALPS